MECAASKPRSRKPASSSSSSATTTSVAEGMESIKRSLKARKRRKTINDQKRSKEIPKSGMSNGYGEIEQAARLLLRVCQDCERTEDVMTYAKQTCAYITQRSGRDFIRLRFIQLLAHSVHKYSDAAAVFKCSACLGYSDCKFSEDTEVVKEPKLQRFLEDTFGVRASLPVRHRPPPPPPPSEEDEEEDDDAPD